MSANHSRAASRLLLAAVLGAALTAGGLVQTGLALAVPAQASMSWLRTPANIAHALGGLTVTSSSGRAQIYSYTDTLEGFEQNYAKGYRIFEVDLIPTRNWGLVARHDWSKSTFAALQQPFPSRVPTVDEFLRMKVLNRYTPLDVDGVIGLMRTHPDVYFITDTKYSDQLHVRHQFGQILRAMGADRDALSKRLIVQIYDRPMLGYVRAMYPFPTIIFTFYRQSLNPADTLRTVGFAKANGIQVLTLDLQHWSSSVGRAVKSAGLGVIINTINSSSQAAALNKAGVRYVMSDALPAYPFRPAPLFALYETPMAPDAIPFNPAND